MSSFYLYLIKILYLNCLCINQFIAVHRTAGIIVWVINTNFEVELFHSVPFFSNLVKKCIYPLTECISTEMKIDEYTPDNQQSPQTITNHLWHSDSESDSTAPNRQNETLPTIPLSFNRAEAEAIAQRDAMTRLQIGWFMAVALIHMENAYVY